MLLQLIINKVTVIDLDFSNQIGLVYNFIDVIGNVGVHFALNLIHLFNVVWTDPLSIDLKFFSIVGVNIRV